jgi:hypothetical protein
MKAKRRDQKQKIQAEQEVTRIRVALFTGR